MLRSRSKFADHLGMSRIIVGVASFACAAVAVWMLLMIGRSGTNIATTSVVAVLLAVAAVLLARAACAPMPDPRVRGRYELGFVGLTASLGALVGYGVGSKLDGLVVGAVLGTLVGALGMLAPLPYKCSVGTRD
jgi:hypothetical protein